VHIAASHYANRLGQIDKVVEQLRAAEPLITETQPPFITALSIHSSISGAYLRVGKTDEARAVLLEARAMVPQPPLNQFLEAIEASIAAQEGNFESARYALEQFEAVLQALKFDGLAFQVPLVAGAILFQEEKYQEAAEQMRLTIEQVDGSFIAGEINAYGMSTLLAQLAQAEILAGDLAAAEKTIERGFRIDPNLAELWSARARLQAARGLDSLAAASANYALTIWSEAAWPSRVLNPCFYLLFCRF
jgi:tetratricopeptide (TPR) repeat protein